MRALLVAAVFALSGCAPPLSDDKAILSHVAEVASVVLSHNNLEGDLSPALWPGLDGVERGYLRPEGLYLRMSGVFVGERGYFVPRRPTEFVAGTSGDPSYKLLG